MKADDLRKASNSCASDVHSAIQHAISVFLSASSTVALLFLAHRLLLYGVSVQPARGGPRKKGRRGKQSPYSGVCSREGKSYIAGASYVMGLAGPTSPFGLKPERKSCRGDAHDDRGTRRAGVMTRSLSSKTPT